VAAGHPETAEAAIRAFSAGGNAFDAALAAMAAACVVEPVLTSLGGGGFLLARPADRPPVLYDFFVQTPRERRHSAETAFYPILADFGTTQQEFHIGAASVATPGAVRGLLHVHRALARLPLREILAPAIGYAAEGVPVNPLQAYIFSIVGPIYRATPAAAALYGDGALQGEGSLFRQPQLADTLDWLAREGDAPFYEGELADRLVRHCEDRGGHLTLADLAGYRVLERAPLCRSFHGCSVLTNPPPSAGGTLIAFALSLLDGQALETCGFGSARHLSNLVQVMADTGLAREDGILGRAERHRGLLDQLRSRLDGHPLNSRGTTHVSTIDSDGNCAALTLSNGEGSGELLPDSGIMLNNMLGEEDLNPAGFNRWPCDVRVSSMMAPTLAACGDRLVALGSGGSNRLRSAILQTLLNMLVFGMRPRHAVEAPRVHLERGVLDIEPGFGPGTLDQLTAEYPRHRLWNSPNLFFGGAHTVTWDGHGFDGAGDHRRGGVFRIHGAGGRGSSKRIPGR
jgi:gamma-glutamyltranspeptidase/glutathione hydrolase